MSKILRIDTSSRSEESHSRQLGDYFVDRWLEKNPRDIVLLRDLIHSPLEHIQQETIKGFYTPKSSMSDTLKAATALSDKLIEELQSSDTLLVTVPIYNFSIPSALKAWIDQIVRIGETFSYENGSFSGLLKVKRVFCICSYGASGYLPGGDFASANFLSPYLNFLFNFLGVETVKFISVESTTADEHTVLRETKKAQVEIDSLVSTYA